MKKPIFTGAGVAIVTPFTSTGEVDYEVFKEIIDHQIAHGTDAIIIAGTTGEICNHDFGRACEGGRLWLFLCCRTGSPHCRYRLQ